MFYCFVLFGLFLFYFVLFGFFLFCFSSECSYIYIYIIIRQTELRSDINTQHDVTRGF